MSQRWTAVARGVATRTLPVLVALGCLGAAAYAATEPGLGRGDSGARPGDSRFEIRGRAHAPSVSRPPRPLIAKHPRKVSTSATAGFTFRSPRGTPRFQCKFDADAWRSCQSPLLLRGVGLGDHGFSVRAVNRAGRRGPATRFVWKRVEPKPFEIEPQLSSLGALYPGAPPVALPVVLRNPNPVRIFVTALRVSVSTEAPGCDSATNLMMTPASASPTSPLVVPAGGSVSLPVASTSPPAIALRDLPVNQDACQGARLPLAFTGEAHG